MFPNITSLTKLKFNTQTRDFTHLSEIFMASKVTDSIPTKISKLKSFFDSAENKCSVRTNCCMNSLTSNKGTFTISEKLTTIMQTAGKMGLNYSIVMEDSLTIVNNLKWPCFRLMPSSTLYFSIMMPLNLGFLLQQPTELCGLFAASCQAYPLRI